MKLAVHSALARPDLAERATAATGEVWPEYNLHGAVANAYWERLDEEFPDFQLALYDEDADELLAQAHSLALVWDGTADGLPAGFDGSLEDGFRARGTGGAPTTASALGIEIPPEHRGRGFARTMILALRETAVRNGLGDLIAPLRPTWKERYPLAPIERYAAWTRPDGLPFDPWIRLHVRLGAEILRAEPRSLGIPGTVAEWESWTGMAFPESGTYVFPHGLAPLEIDREADRGTYYEPNVWVRHRVR